MSALRIVTWNIYGAGGTRLDKVADVLAALSPDLVALQEVRAPGDEASPVDALASRTGLVPVPGPARRIDDDGGWFGNALLLPAAPDAVASLDLAVAGREERVGIHARLASGVDVFALHLGLSLKERRVQATRLARALDERAPHPALVLGDLNEWRRVGALAPLASRLEFAPRRRTFPSRWPLLSLDRIAVRALDVSSARPVRKERAHRVSDHLPLLAEVGPA